MSYAITLASSANPTKPCKDTTFTATVTLGGGTVTTGSVLFFVDNKADLLPTAVSTSGTATLTEKFDKCHKTRTVTAYYLPPTSVFTTLVETVKKC